MTSSLITQAVFESDFNRALSTRFAAANKRHGLLLLCSFDGELAKIARQTSDPLLQRIRTQFFREALYEKAGAGHWLAAELITTFSTRQSLFRDLEGLIEAHECSQDQEASSAARWDGFCQRQSVLFQLARSYLTDRPIETEKQFFHQCGLAYGGALLLCEKWHQSDPAAETGGLDEFGDAGGGMEQFQQIAAAAFSELKSQLQAVSPVARAAILPLALVPPYLDLFQASDKTAKQPIDLHPARKAWILWRAARRGFR